MVGQVTNVQRWFMTAMAIIRQIHIQSALGSLKMKLQKLKYSSLY